MNKHKDSDDKLLITLSDILSLFRQSKMRILRWVIALGALGALLALIQPIKYRAEATFRERSIKSGMVSNSLLQLLSSDGLSGGQENEASSLIKSRKLMQEVIKKLHLQGTLIQQCEAEGTTKKIRRNLLIAWNAFRQSPKPVLEDLHCPVRIEALDYQGEIPIAFIIELEADGTFGVQDASDPEKELPKGKLGSPFITDQANFILALSEGQTIIPQKITLAINSLANTSADLCRRLQIETTKNDKGVLKLVYESRDRHAASHFINTTMQCYQDYLKKHHNKIAQMQLDYLHTRQSQLASNLTGLMQRHADNLSNDLFHSGFVDTNKEMDFLAKSQHEYREKLLANELELKRLENVHSNSYVYYDSYKLHEGDSATINQLLAEIRNYKQRRDGLEIEIQKKAAIRGDDLHFSLDQQLKELKEVQQYTIELQDVIDRFHQHLEPAPSDLLDDSRFLIKGWFERLSILEETDPIEWQKSRESFQFYLTNLERLFNVHEKILQARLTHQQNPSGEYQGIDLKIAEELYVEYSKQVIQIEATIRQNLFFISQMEDPNFEITSLSAGLTDPISQDMIKKASNLVLTLKDQNNQSSKEQERLKNELALQRTFLSLHLKQMIQLMELNKKLVDEKVYALQSVSLELIHQQVSLLENTLKDYTESRIENLRQERMLIKQHLRNIHTEMAGIPKKWVAEQLIEQEVDTNQLIVEEIAKMVESKNIAHNLEVIQSAPIDRALPPVHPLTPNLLMSILLGGVFGGVIGAGLVLGSTLSKGLKVSIENLKLMGHHVSGTLSSGYRPHSDMPISDDDLETLRRLRSYVAPTILDSGLSDAKEAERLLLIEGSGPDYSADLIELFVKKGKKIILLHLDFDETAINSSTGLVQYLEGRVDFPTIESTARGDVIQAGGTSRYAVELLSSKAFKELISRLQERYDWIIGVSRSLPRSAEAESLIPLFPSIAITVGHEKVEDLDFYMQLIKDDKHKVTFVVTDSHTA